jgi:histidinol-phosphate aminotransferase
MRMVRKVASPYNVNSVALACLPAVMEDQEYVSGYVAEVVRGRERLQRALDGLGIRYWPSRGNFVLASFGTCAQKVVRALGQRGILVRDRSSDPGCAGCVRMTVGNERQMDKLFVALEATVREIGMGEKVGS